MKPPISIVILGVIFWVNENKYSYSKKAKILVILLGVKNN